MHVAGIGVGGMGAANLANLQDENIVALCDVDPTFAANTIRRYPKAKVYTDFREMLDKQRDIDGVVVATPDHTHAVISMAAIRCGKHVYCQKPLTHNVYEARMLAQAAKEAKVFTQMGIQGHSMECHQLICEWVQAGVIGEVREVERLVRSVLLSLGPCGLEQQLVGAAPGDSARAGGPELGFVDRPRAVTVLSPRLPSHDLAVLVGFRLRNDGRPRRAHARSGLSALKLTGRPRVSKPLRAATRRKSIPSPQSSPSNSPRGMIFRP